MGFVLNEVVPWGRSFAEYVKMFDLEGEDFKSRILSCGDGPASFNCEMNQLGHTVTSIDPIYQFSGEQIEQQINKTFDDVIEQVSRNKEDFVWETVRSMDELGRVRLAAMREFLADFEKGKKEKRYFAESLPSLSFEDGRFDLALCSHFLFLYSKQLSLEFHHRAIAEMLRVAGEVRVFPLLELAGQPSPYLNEIIERFKSAGFKVEVKKVPYEFQRGGNKMMRIKNSGTAIWWA
ncbi:MAG: SAM-dependent methyltransferase [Nitrospinaceae bacterium]|nr:MAG: SAM-dependent methyltransferase [Nitrospinaceae bacterium]